MTGTDIPLNEVRLEDADVAAATRVLRSGQLTQGSEVAAFEEEFATLVSGRPCVAVNSGTSALHLALLAHGIGRGDEVVVPSFTFAATANAVEMTGARAVFADIDPRTFCLDADSVAAATTSRTAGVIAVHLFGQPAGVRPLQQVTASRGLLLVEDACQAHGAGSPVGPAGALGQAAAFSFYATKNMTTGEGGMVVCEDPAVAQKVRMLRNQGMRRRYEHEVVGLNNRMTDVAAAIGRLQLAELAARNRRRRAIASRYDERLVGVTTPPVEAGVEHVYHQYTVRALDRDALRAGLAGRGVETGTFYGTPVHRQPAYRSRPRPVLPVTERAANEVLSLPVRPNLTDAEVDAVVAAVNELGAGGG